MKNEETINLTVADLRRAHDSVSCSTAKQVIKALKPEAFEEEIKFDIKKIYAVKTFCGDIFILRRIEHRIYGWSSLNSTSGHCGVREDPTKAIEAENDPKGRVKVFNNQKDFINWCYEQTR